jgi:hypothetical protein
MERRLCPRCGAYWQCDCVIEELTQSGALTQPVAAGCSHDWTDAVGVDVVDLEAARVLVCRLCGLYAVEERAAS